jgi:beta-phosphoglucomutase family hydrolase
LTTANNNKKFRAVIFDMDGLLLDTEKVARTAWQQGARDYGFELSDQLFTEVIGLTREGIQRKLFDVFGPLFPHDQVRAKRTEYFQELLQKHGVPVKEGAVQLLAMLKQLDVPCALATSTHLPIAAAELKEAGLVDYFQALVGGDQIQNGKPAPDIFLKAAAQLGIPPEECIVLEDSNAGIKAAAAAGMTAIMVPDLAQPTEEVKGLPYAIVPSLTDAAQLLNKLLQ